MQKAGPNNDYLIDYRDGTKHFHSKKVFTVKLQLNQKEITTKGRTCCIKEVFRLHSSCNVKKFSLNKGNPACT